MEVPPPFSKMIKNAITIDGRTHELVKDVIKTECRTCSIFSLCTEKEKCFNDDICFMVFGTRDCHFEEIQVTTTKKTT